MTELELKEWCESVVATIDLCGEKGKEHLYVDQTKEFDKTIQWFEHKIEQGRYNDRTLEQFEIIKTAKKSYLREKNLNILLDVETKGHTDNDSELRTKEFEERT